MGQQSAGDVVRRYLQDAIAAEKNFESQLRTFGGDTEDAMAKQLFFQHADETRMQHERLTARLNALGGDSSAMKTFFANLFGGLPKLVQIGHDEAEKTTQDLIMAYAVENSEIAMYEAMAAAAAAAGDTQTEQLAREIQQEERQTAQKVWNLISPCARDAFMRVTGGQTVVSRA